MLAPKAMALFLAAASPPHLYSVAVMKLYMTRALGPNEQPHLEEILGKLRGWHKLPKETLMLVSHDISHMRVRESKKHGIEYIYVTTFLYYSRCDRNEMEHDAISQNNDVKLHLLCI